MISLLINFCIFVYVIGVFGSIVAGLSLFYRYKPSELRRVPILIFVFLIPGVNHVIMWEAFKSYKAYEDTAKEGIIILNKRKSLFNVKNFNK